MFSVLPSADEEVQNVKLIYKNIDMKEKVNTYAGIKYNTAVKPLQMPLILMVKHETKIINSKLLRGISFVIKSSM